MAIATPQFSFIQQFLLEATAIAIDETQKYLVEARLFPLAQISGLNSVNEFIRRLQTGLIESFKQAVIEAFAPRETCFFRDFHPFETLKSTVLPDLITKRSQERQLSIWCAGCATGQEAYSIALTLLECFPQLKDWKIQLYACDLSEESIQYAAAGAYNQIEINRGLPTAHLVKYFFQEGNRWRINEDVRRICSFQVLNLADTWPSFQKMDIVFMRNVLTYFNKDARKEVLKRMRRVLKTDGYLFVGAKETIHDIDDSYEPLSSGKGTCYQFTQAFLDQLQKEAIFEKYHLDGISEGVLKLARLVEKRDWGNTTEITKIIERDPALRKRLIKAAYKQSVVNGPEATIEEALIRTGMEFLLILAMGEPMAKALKDTLQTMVSASPKQVDGNLVSTAEYQVQGIARFSGKATGAVKIRIQKSFGIHIAAHILGMPVEEVDEPGIKDVFSELVNMIVGSFKSNLCNAGLTCDLSLPKVDICKSSEIPSEPKGKQEVMAFQCDSEPIFVDLIVETIQ